MPMRSSSYLLGLGFLSWQNINEPLLCQHGDDARVPPLKDIQVTARAKSRVFTAMCHDHDLVAEAEQIDERGKIAYIRPRTPILSITQRGRSEQIMCDKPVACLTPF